MARRYPKDSAETRSRMKGAMRESEEDLLRAARRQALDAIRRLSKETPAPSVSPEITPGIYFEDVGIQFASRKKRKKRNGPTYA